MEAKATGNFDVKVTPQAWSESRSESRSEPTLDKTLGRFQLDKHYHGDLEAASQGLMLSAGNPREGSAGYVAIESVTGTLHGRSGGFALQHNGTMKSGSQELAIIVSPGSGTGELTGIAGTMTIQIADGKHSYEFVYTLASIQ